MLIIFNTIKLIVFKLFLMWSVYDTLLNFQRDMVYKETKAEKKYYFESFDASNSSSVYKRYKTLSIEYNFRCVFSFLPEFQLQKYV